MNTETQTPEPRPETNGHQPSADPPQTHSWRQTGKFARLPKTLRDKINTLIQDGVPYQDIIDSLGEVGKDLNIVNLSRWKDGGHQDWLLEQAHETCWFDGREYRPYKSPSHLVG